MSKYVIHACPQRMWYVDNYLVPSLKEQGIQDVLVKCDTNQVGNLENCMDIFAHITQPGNTWHLQDDVVICRNFKERTEACNISDIVCGFAAEGIERAEFESGYVKPENMWWSFPCISIPNHLARECAAWYYEKAKYKPIYTWIVGTKKFDDYLFLEFLKEVHPDYKVLNLKPNLVDHIDYLLGGTTINKQRKNPIVRSKYFEDTDLVEELKKRLAEERNKVE